MIVVVAGADLPLAGGGLMYSVSYLPHEAVRGLQRLSEPATIYRLDVLRKVSRLASHRASACAFTTTERALTSRVSARIPTQRVEL